MMSTLLGPSGIRAGFAGGDVMLPGSSPGSRLPGVMCYLHLHDLGLYRTMVLRPDLKRGPAVYPVTRRPMAGPCGDGLLGRSRLHRLTMSVVSLRLLSGPGRPRWSSSFHQTVVTESFSGLLSIVTH